jgi:hypothetical protein
VVGVRASTSLSGSNSSILLLQSLPLKDRHAPSQCCYRKRGPHCLFPTSSRLRRRRAINIHNIVRIICAVLLRKYNLLSWVGMYTHVYGVPNYVPYVFEPSITSFKCDFFSEHKRSSTHSKLRSVFGEASYWRKIRCSYVRANQIPRITSFNRRKLHSVMVRNGL